MASDEPSVAASAAPPPTADPQDPLPESNWKYRRIFVFSAGICYVVGVGVIVGLLYSIAKATLAEGARDPATTRATVEALYSIAWWLVMLALVDRVLYMIAPSAEQATKMLATVSAWKGGVSTTSLARSSTPGGGSAEASVTAGPAVVAPLPIAPPEPEVDAAPTSAAP
jgi:hypothetical protein